MNNSELQQILTRLETVEKQNRKLKAIFLFFTLTLIICFSLYFFGSNEKQVYAVESEKIPDVIKAKKFIVVDDEGKGKIVLVTDPNSNGLIAILNKDGTPTFGFLNEGK